MSYFVSLSGGLDSTTLLANVLKMTSQPEDVHPVFFNYGSKHNPFELECCKDVCKHYNILDQLEVVDLRPVGIFNPETSALMADNNLEVPAAAYSEPGSLDATVVPGRNMVMISILSAKAESLYLQRKAQRPGAPQTPVVVALAVHSGDHALYPDCRPQFITAVANSVTASTEGRVRIFTPFVDMSKAAIVGVGLELGVPYELTRSCYRQQEKACGECGTCRERLKAFAENGFNDPAQYA